MYFVLAQKRAMYKYMYFVPKLKISVLHVPPERMVVNDGFCDTNPEKQCTVCQSAAELILPKLNKMA